MATLDVLVVEHLALVLLSAAVQQTPHEAARVVGVHSVIPGRGGHQQGRVLTSCHLLRVDVVVGGGFLQESPVLEWNNKKGHRLQRFTKST